MESATPDNMTYQVRNL